MTPMLFSRSLAISPSLFLVMWVRVHAAVSTKTCEVEKNPDVIDQVTDSWMYRELSLSDPVSVLDCAVRCIQDTSCVTFMVNLASKRCRFHAARISSQNTLTKKEGFASYDTCRAAGAFGSTCEFSQDCTLANSRCLTEKICACEIGTSYSPNTISCVKEACQVYGSEFTVISDVVIVGRRHQIPYQDTNSLTPTGCQARCLALTDQAICRSATLNAHSCNISSDIPPDWYYTSAAEQTFYFQRHCEYSRDSSSSISSSSGQMVSLNIEEEWLTETASIG